MSFGHFFGSSELKRSHKGNIRPCVQMAAPFSCYQHREGGGKSLLLIFLQALCVAPSGIICTSSSHLFWYFNRKTPQKKTTLIQ